jgi:hypothetical protein
VNTPIIDDILATHEQGFDFRGWVDMGKLATELLALRAERDALKTTPTPPRRWRECKGVTYRDGFWWYDHQQYPAVASLIWVNNAVFTDADHAALLALRDDPWETLEDVVREWLRSHHFRVETEPFADLCTRLRAHLATQPQPVSVPYRLPITPEQAVEVLVAHGASIHKLAHAPHFYRQDTDILVLPTATTEPTP